MDEQQLVVRLVDAMHATIQGRTTELDALDEAIGDGDHGTNLARAFATVAAAKAQLAGLPLGEALRRVGRTLADETGGASGRLYGALFRGMGEAAPAGHVPTAGELVGMLQAGIDAVQAETGAKKGDKTLLDVLIPVSQSLRNLVEQGRTDQLGARALAAAAHGLHATTNMQAKHGLAADLGAASINRIDPGACSCALLIGAVVGALETGQQAA
jgi:phosphoenolpyruvate---glycerone phosphotransferase subunit DhaL